jgi:hypothetical protein
MSKLSFKKLRLRFSRFFPAAFALLAAMAILGGFLHRPSNPDGLTQRIPHLLNWLAEGRWHWIENAPSSFNSHAVGFEWLMSPMLALLKTDRWIFLYNGISFLLLPGLLFSLFTRLGVTPRAAWYWMWLIPGGYCFLTQAGSIGNDAAGALFAIAAVDFALRAKNTGRLSDLWLSILSASLLSGMKMSNLALGLPWLVAIWPSLHLLWRRPLASSAVVAISIFSSALPLMFLLHQHGGGWTGAQLERGLPLASPAVSLAGNGLNLALENLLPPVFPMADWWNVHAYKLLPANFIAKLEHSFEPGASHLAAIEIQYEICAGIGFGLILLLLISWLWARFSPRSQPDRPSDLHLTLVRWSPLVSLVAFMLAVDVSGPARLITPYYCLLMPLLLTGRSHEILVRRKWWRGAAALTLLIAAGLLIINPPRPLWPARTILNPLSKKYPQSSIITKATMLYDAYAERWDALAPIRNRLPPDARNIGFVVAFMSGSTMETSLWRPFGKRRIWHLPRSVSQTELERKDIQYIVVGTDSSSPAIHERCKQWMDTWLLPNKGKVVAQESVKVLATAGREPWYLIEVSPNRE